MLKKSLGIVFILFATTLFLAHAVIPHQHHEDNCKNPLHWHHSNNSEEAPIHDDHGENDDDCCALKLSFATSQENQKKFSDRIYPNFFQMFTSENLTYSDPGKKANSIPLDFFSIRLQELHLASHRALRAPPTL